MSKPAMVPSRREVWFTDGVSGFYNLRVKDARLARRGPARLPGAPVADRPAQHRARAASGSPARRCCAACPRPRRRTKRSWRWCVKGSKGTVSAAFDQRGRVALVTTTATHHGNRRVRPGSTASHGCAAPTAAAARSSRTLVRANGRSPRLFGVRRGRVRFIAVTTRRHDRQAKDAAGLPAPRGRTPLTRRPCGV